MIPDTVHVKITCPLCGQELAFEVTEEILVSLKFVTPLQLRDGHEISLNTTHYHYVESNGAVSQIMLIVITHCPKENQGESQVDQPGPWYGLYQFWETALDALDEGESE